MTSEEIKQEVKDWIANGCIYDDGVELYKKYGRNVMLKRDFPGHKMRYESKIIYELCKSVGLEYGDILTDKNIVIGKPEVKPVAAPVVQIPEAVKNNLPDKIASKPVDEYPPIIRRVIAEYAELFQERSKTHQVMTEMPESNSQAVKTKRAELFELVKAYSIRLEFLYGIRTEFERCGSVPDEEAVWPKPKKKVQPELPNDVNLLKKMKKNQQSANTKDQNLLDYQSEKRGDKPKPMPQGPKRMKLENRIKARIAMIEQIDYKLLEVNAN